MRNDCSDLLRHFEDKKPLFMDKKYRIPIFADFVMFANAHLLIIDLAIRHDKDWKIKGGIKDRYQECLK